MWPLTASILLVALGPLRRVTASKFECPEKSGIFPDPDQCDRYWVCHGGRPSRQLCPDGLVFHPEKGEGEDPCDNIHGVPDKCEGREERQRAKPGDAHCPRQNGVYPSEKPHECDVFYSCLNGVGSPTRCPEGLHYSEKEGICVWARDSGRTGCGVSPAEEEPRKRRRKEQTQAPATKKEGPKKLANGFSCPGGKLGVHIALAHPTDCRSYYVCLNGVEASPRGCSQGQVFNPDTKSCDLPSGVPGCESYYDKPPRTRVRVKSTQRENVEPSLALGDSDIPGDDLKEFLANLISKPGDIRELLVDLISSPGKQESESEIVKPTLSEDSFETPRESRKKLFPLLRRNKFQPKLKVIDDSENEIKTDFPDEHQMTVNLRELSPEIAGSDDEMMNTVLNALMSEEKKEEKQVPSITSGRRRRLRRPNLFSTEERRKSSIINRLRSRVRLRDPPTTAKTTTTTLQSTTEDSEEGERDINVLEKEVDEEPRSPFIRPNRFKPASRPRLPFRSTFREDKEDQLKEMSKALGLGEELQEEFDKFLSNRLRKSRPGSLLTGTRDRAKIRNSFLQSRFKNNRPIEEISSPTTTEISTTSTTTTTTTTQETTTIQITTTQSTTLTTTTTTSSTTITTTTTTTTTTTSTQPTTTTTRSTSRPVTSVRPTLAAVTNSLSDFQNHPPVIDITNPEYEDEPFEYVYYEYYYDYEYDDDYDSDDFSDMYDNTKDVSEPVQNEPLHLPDLKEQLLQQQQITNPNTNSPLEEVEYYDEDYFDPRTRPPPPPQSPPTTPPPRTRPTPHPPPPATTNSHQSQPPLNRRQPLPPQPQPPPVFEESRFPHFQNFKPIDISLDPPVPSLPPPPVRQPEPVREPKSQNTRQQANQIERVRQKEILRQMEIEKQNQLERQKVLEKEKKAMEALRQREKLRIAELERQQKKKIQERERAATKSVSTSPPPTPPPIRDEVRQPVTNPVPSVKEEPRTSEDLTEENVTIRQGQGKPEVTTFGPFSAFKNFPSFPDGVLENQQDQLLELRGPNLLPTKPTPPPSSRRPPPKESQRPPVVPSSPDPNEFIFLPSPPLREREPAISVFLDDNDRAPAPSVFLPEPTNSRPQPPPNTFFNTQTKPGQSQTRIPLSEVTTTRVQQPPRQQQPFTFFGTNFQSEPRPSPSRPISFPVDQPSQVSGSGNPFVNFNNFRAPPEQPRAIGSVFSGGNSQTQFQNRNNLNSFTDDARFDIRPSPSQSQISPSFPVQRPDPPSTVFQLSPSSSSSQPQSQSRQIFPSFPQPQFGGFRPIKRHLNVEEGDDELFIEDLVKEERSKRHGNKQKMKQKNHRNKQRKKSDHERKISDVAEARQHMQDALNKGLAKVYYEEFIQKNNYVDYYDYYENYPDYYYDYPDYYI